MEFADIFSVRFPIIAPIVLEPLPGSPLYRGDMDSVVERALADARTLTACGVDGLSFENMGDAPFYKDEAPPETIASFGRVVAEVRAITSLPLGVNVLRNCARASLGIAYAFGASFIRVNVLTETYATDQGIIEGPATELMRVRRLMGAERIAVFADVHVKHASPLLDRPIEESALDLVERGLADVLVVSGSRTGSAASVDDIRAVAAVKSTVIGSGLTPENAPALLGACHGAIVASVFRRDGNVYNPIERSRVERFMDVVRSMRSA